MNLIIRSDTLYTVEAAPEETCVEIPEGVRVIERSAFGKAAHLQRLLLPNSLETLDLRDIVRCPMLNELSCHARLLEKASLLPPLHLTIRGEVTSLPECQPLLSLICPDTPLQSLSAEYRKLAIVTFIQRYEEPQLWQHDVYQHNDSYLRSIVTRLIRMAHKHPEIWYWLLRQRLLPEDQIDLALMHARLAGDAALIAALMNYRSEQSPEDSGLLSASLLDDFDREMEALLDPETDEQKAVLWNFSHAGDAVHSYQGFEKSIVYPRTFRGNPITVIRDRLPFALESKHYEQLQSIVVPSGYTHIGQNAFSGVKHLTCLSLPVTIVEMAERASHTSPIAADTVRITQESGDEPGLGCLRLPRLVKTIIVEEGVTDLPQMVEDTEEVFTNLRQLVLPRSLQRIIAFPALKKHSILLKVDRDHPYLRRTSEGCLLSRDGRIFYYAPETLYGHYELPATVRTVMPYAFCGCGDLTSVTLPDGLEHLCGHAFEDCKSMLRVIMPDSLLSVGERCFSGCVHLTRARFSASLMFLGKYAFHNCAIVSACLPDTLRDIGNGVFSQCKRLAEVRLPDQLTDLPAESFANCTTLHHLTLPPHVGHIGGLAFQRCHKLTLELPDDCVTIASTAFIDAYRCTLRMSRRNPLRDEVRKFPGVTIEAE